ncbi:hypothetical protein NEOLI_000742 [Neolecta irregularis DAH-3]|uniref:Subtelomeric hrmA-associated cluster protein AFUB-079030/YDR124W-like helical bundle domain-containing protein n=1 Tax=Neolecta irregularis (strain DAH-3) TaxID=1198029 RepID=A0A1U7LWR5_NEOID|nr:hypothetical protein NEOLI_000742 [Neolecta irregularis DAH-3]|eukprot:OLL26951.1 hypothetical protein NEOLI_000742 [Neolecta irregularis DAH-3]
MPRIPVRVEPYSSPSKQHRHFKNKRDQILKALGKASYINGSHFAILWVNSRGESESYASDVFQAKLTDWFGPKVLHDAKSLVATAAHDGHADRKFFQDAAADRDNIDDELEPEDQVKKSEATPNAPVLALLPPAPPELHRSFSMPSQITLSTDRLPLHLETALLSPSSFTEYKPLIIGSTPQVSAFLETRFRQLQQMVCKIVAKAWIKIIEPKKQTRYPYNRGEESRPDWWPEHVRHKEPDHLMKPERISLLLRMLRCGKVPVNRLELATAEVAAYIPPDKTNLLREIYRVAREEERLRIGEIDPSTKTLLLQHIRITIPLEQ